MDYYMAGLRNWSDFEGRASRTQYWMFALINFIVFVVLAVLTFLHIPILSMLFGLVYLLYALALLVPSLAIAVRRMHDTDRSGWWLLVSLIPFLGGLAVLVLLCLPSHVGPVRFGSTAAAIGDAGAPMV